MKNHESESNESYKIKSIKLRQEACLSRITCYQSSLEQEEAKLCMLISQEKRLSYFNAKGGTN